MIDTTLEILAREYVQRVEEVGSLMLVGLELDSRRELLVTHRMKHGMGEFHLDGINKYCFHGRGCRFENDNLKIDWDFGYDERWCGISPWMLFKYIRDNKSINEFCDGDQIKKVFDSWVADKKMMIKYGLYYFV